MVVSGPPPREVEIVHAGTDGAAPDDVVARLLQSSAPELLHLPRRVVAEGWDNVLVRLGSTLLMRLPRRAQAAELTRHEQLWLPVLAPPLPVAVPVPVHAGRPVADYPWPWSIIRWREGVVASQRPRQLATSWAADLAATFVVLHQPAPPEAPHNPFRAVPLAPRDEVIRERLALGRERGLDLAAAVRAWERGIAAPVWAEPPVWVHGDPHPGNLLVRPGTPGRPDALDALLDWGDLSAGDPACDLAAAWLVFDRAGRRVFRDTYDFGTRRRAPDPGRWDRAAAWAVSMASSVVVGAPDDVANRPWADAALAELAERDD